MPRFSLQQITALLIALGLLSACGNSGSLSGIYGDPKGFHMEFRSNGKVEITQQSPIKTTHFKLRRSMMETAVCRTSYRLLSKTIGPTFEFAYVVEDRKVKLTDGKGAVGVVLNIDDKGRIDGPVGTWFVMQEMNASLHIYLEVALVTTAA